MSNDKEKPAKDEKPKKDDEPTPEEKGPCTNPTNPGC